MKYISTRDKNKTVSGPEAVVEGLSAGDGGLFVPAAFPAIGLRDIAALASRGYAERAAGIVSAFLPELKDSLPAACSAAYSRFDGDPAPLVKIDGNLFMLELFHGPTHAFKDIALTLLPRLLTASKRALGKTEKTLILVATSGDTGKAALEGFAGVPDTDVMVFYPVEGVSYMQKLQMRTTRAKNCSVTGVRGNFDDAQNAVKAVFNDKSIADDLQKLGYKLSSANSINFGRLVPQIVYYFSAYADMLDSNVIEPGDAVNFCVPSGNFGDILAGYYAKRMGLPVGKLICASNKNNVLTDFITTGEYSLKREFYKTSSPSMDILISSNLERLLFELSGRDDKSTAKRMADLKSAGGYRIGDDELKALQADFCAYFADENEVFKAIEDMFDEYGYLPDPHTGVAMAAYNKYVAATGDKTKTVVISTANPYKFTPDVLRALGKKPLVDERKNIERLEELSAMEVPPSLFELFDLPAVHKDIIDKERVAGAVANYVKRK
ncbi:MAG: threonine synthase [Clostridiales bacterium]|nr:threonine synthase [Clostridiales bacterium]